MSKSGSSTFSYGIETGVREFSCGQRTSAARITSGGQKTNLGSGSGSTGGGIGMLVGSGSKTGSFIFTPVKRETVISGDKMGISVSSPYLGVTVSLTDKSSIWVP